MRIAALALALSLLGCPPSDPGDRPTAPCVPATCTSLDALCGPVNDGCGGLLACGGCGSGEVCGADGPGRCGPAICTESGFCWETPLPQGNTLRAAIAFGAEDVWMTGEAGTVLRWDGAHWRATAAGTSENLGAIWGASSSDLWAAGGTVLRRWNGAAWAAWPAPDAVGVVKYFSELAGTGADDVWLAGNAVFRWNGSTWAVVPGATGVDRITIAAPGDVWAISNLSSVVRWQGSGWTTVRSGDHGLTSIWAASPTDVWVGGEGLLHFDGTSWTTLTSLDGTAIASTALTVRGSSAGDVWVVTGGGLVFRRDALGWKKLASPPLRGLRAVAPTVPGAAVAGGDQGELVLATGTGVTSWRSQWGQNGAIVAATLDGDLVVVNGAGGAAAWDGAGWQALPLAGIHDPNGMGGAALQDVWGSSLDDLWAVGGGFYDGYRQVWHRTTGDWSGANLPSPSWTPTSIWGSGPTDIWAVGPYSSVSHYDGTWSSAGGVGPDLLEVWGSGPNDVWAVGYGGTILHNVAGAIDTWTAADSTTTADLFTVWGSGPSDIWAAGAGGTLLHWSGSAWSAGASLTTDTIVRLWGSGPQDVWAADSWGGLHHLDAGGWSSFFSGTRLAYQMVQGDGGSVLWIGGNGTLLRFVR